MNKIVKTLVSATILALAASSAVSAETVLRFAEATPNRGARAEAVEQFMTDVKKLSNGDIGFEMHWGGALLDYKSVTKGVSSGTADLGSMLAAYDPKTLRVVTIGDVPTKYSDPWVGMRAMYELMTTNKEVQGELAKQNLVYVGGFTTTGAQFECGRDAKIETIADIKGKRIRAVGYHAKVLSELGANLVNLSQGDTYQALDTGLIDCATAYLYAISAFKTYEVANNYTIVNWVPINGFAMLMNLDMWNDLNKKQQGILREAGSEMVDFYGKLQIDEMKEVVDGLRSGSIGRKVSVHEMSQEEHSKLDKAGEKYAKDWVGYMNKDGVDGQKIWDQYEGLLAKYQAELDAKGYPWKR
ncbi:C4-dicarboxylate TRAP transporter substrate-binding protein [Alcaligenaceae bacterium]|nr:C4-dicarboxylate TRAP transporter substrate-binding protein [Alcaligenaceae bacterium]